jgi:septum formation protein
MASRLILASTSPYRRELLARLRVEFDVVAPDVEETRLPGEPPRTLAMRLAAAKAAAICAHHPDAWVIGCDQVAAFDDNILGKPGTRDAAIGQLAAMSGRNVEFFTAVCLSHADGPAFDAIDSTIVRFRPLCGEEIARYLDAEQPFDCAGSFKAEGLGITLFEAIESGDPTALIGLPLIATAHLLRKAGFALP